MEAGRVRNQESKMRGTINQDNKLTDIYLPRKCDYTDRIITSKDHASIQLSIADVPPPPLSSMRTEPSTSPRPAPSPSPDSSGPPAKATPLSRKYSRKGNSSDRHSRYISHHAPLSASLPPAPLHTSMLRRETLGGEWAYKFK